MGQDSPLFGPEVNIKIVIALLRPRSDDPNKTLLTRMLDLENSGLVPYPLTNDTYIFRKFRNWKRMKNQA